MPLHPGSRGLEDDCAVLEIGNETLVITHDSMAEGTHFLPDADPADVAWKLVAVNLSDLAAKGAEPVGILLGYMLGDDDVRFLHGLKEVTEKYDIPLLGGDTIRADGPRTLGLTAIGRATHTPVPSRSGAQVGDGIFLCGLIGNAMAGLQQLKRIELEKETGPRPEFAGDIPRPFVPEHSFIEALLRPKPMLNEGIALTPYVTAMMDVSDGLYLDATRMADASGVSFAINQDEVPHSEKFRELASHGNLLDVMSKGRPMRTAACSWGDDYALLFTAPPKARLPVECTRIGKVHARKDRPLLVDRKPPPVVDLGWMH